MRLMNEWFATSADVYRLTGELQAEHDQQPTADQGPATVAGSCTRLARMIGLDAAQAPLAAWQQLARSFRQRQVVQIADGLRQQQRQLGLASGLPLRVVTAGCGAFLVPDVLVEAGLASDGVAATTTAYADLAGVGPQLHSWAGVCAPAVAVARLRAPLAR